jgi:hypothetical protein
MTRGIVMRSTNGRFLLREPVTVLSDLPDYDLESDEGQA